jgi:transcriptional regulator with XRE-family HTH domain
MGCEVSTKSHIGRISDQFKFFEVVILQGLKKSNLVGEQIRKIRNEMGLSQQALAAKCQRLGWDASREMINHIEMHIRLVRDYEVIALAAALNTSPENILPTQKEISFGSGKKGGDAGFQREKREIVTFK